MYKDGNFVIFLLCAFLIGYEATVAPKILMNDGFKMPSVAIGTWLGLDQMGNRVNPRDTEVEDAVIWALEAGYRHIDTAHIYKTEDQVGRALTRKFADGMRREDVFVTTKLWNDCHAKDKVVPALIESLRQLKLSYVDMYLIHWPVGQFANGTYDNTDYLETWRGMTEAKRLGLTRSIGLSNFNRQQIDRIMDEGLEVPAALQVEININLQQPALLEYCKKHSIVVMGYSPFGSIFPDRAKLGAPGPRVNDLTLTQAAHKSNGYTVPQMVLRYLHDLGIVILPKSLKKSRIESNIDIFDIELTDEIKRYLKYADRNYRTVPQLKWVQSIYYPFEWSL